MAPIAGGNVTGGARPTSRSARLGQPVQPIQLRDRSVHIVKVNVNVALHQAEGTDRIGARIDDFSQPLPGPSHAVRGDLVVTGCSSQASAAAHPAVAE
jgi:hypothetical protein